MNLKNQLAINMSTVKVPAKRIPAGIDAHRTKPASAPTARKSPKSIPRTTQGCAPLASIVQPNWDVKTSPIRRLRIGDIANRAQRPIPPNRVPKKTFSLLFGNCHSLFTEATKYSESVGRFSRKECNSSSG